ncbi:xylan 1,4-beta-xylosidase [Treponema bryantii]|uniref:Xylan 1,4-beta-xylosidase n=1 Tax=Treponema bryantii TaxID=163 RepID=A0A1H8ZVL2_9SPIR|nr:glycosyl hydrolase [Treponema bryantii]SEP68311.1 xylan 1,4-beta-xylosidase [Treponema bryantii]
MNYKITGDENITFNNNAFYCIGTGRMGLALQKQYYEQLKLVQEKIGFEHIRGHGLFHNDMAIYREFQPGVPEFGPHAWEGRDEKKVQVEYNWTYLDMVMDSYKELHIKPFIELGFMPKQLASGDNTIFYWKGNTTPPNNYDRWANLIKATLQHLMDRYGTEEVVTWPVEVWNEPNLPGFWKDANMEEYFKLYDVSSRAVKEVDKRFKVGGPAVCGGTDKEWIKAFLEFVRKNKCPLDFVSRHHYTTEFPNYDGHYGYPKLHPKTKCFEQLDSTRGIVDSFKEFKGMDINVTEFNTSYIPNAPLHDMNLNAAYIALMLSTFGDNHKSYSYWTFGDIFEEGGVPYTPFHGGFGLVANGLIPKPTFWTFAFYKKLTKSYEKCVLKTPECIVTKCKDGSFRGIAWNIDDKLSGKEITLNLTLPMETKENVLITELVDEEVCNPLKVWHDMGEPANPSQDELELLRTSAQPFVKTERCKNKVSLNLKENAVCYFEIKAAPIKSDRGYTYGRLN